MKKANLSVRLLAMLLVLVLTLGLLPATAMAAAPTPVPQVEEMTVVVSMEGLTLGQGMYVEPTAYTLTEINELVGTQGYGPYTKDTLTAVMATLAMVIDHGLETNMTGNWEDSFYLSEVKDLDTGTVNIPEIIGENGGPTNDDNTGNDDEWLGEFDYSYMSGWMITVNNNLIPVGAAGYDFEGYRDNGIGENYGDLYVVRWHFSTWGYGMDLGLDNDWGMGEPYFTAANKDMLYASYAMAGNLSAKADALAVMENLTATQSQVDAAVVSKWADPDTTTSYWPYFRGDASNMAITDTKTPHTVDSTVTKWAAKLGSGWSASPSVQIIADDALITNSGTTLYKLDLQTGEILATGTMSTSSSWGYTPPIYADGLIICPLGGGTLEAFDAKTLESVWLYKDALGGQANSPIAYSNGKVYSGFWNGEKNDANIVCVSTADGSLVWNKTVPGGVYWAGGVVVGDALIIGTDDGTSGSAGDSRLYALNKNTGAVISDFTLTGCGDQRSCISYSKDKGRVYFTTKNGYIGSAAVNATTGVLSDLKTVKHSGAQSTSTPLVYGDKVYFCCGSGVVPNSNGQGYFVVANADTLEMLYAVEMLGYPQASTLLSTAYLATEGKLYFYNTYNGKPGGLTLIKIDPTKNDETGYEKVEIYDAAGYEQFCIASPICGPDGTIYYKNDSGYVLAVGSNQAYMTGITADTGAQKGEFKVSESEIEWVVPIGTTAVNLTPTISAGSTFTVNGAANTAVALEEGKATAVIEVVCGNDKRTYTVKIREQSNDASLSGLKINQANSAGSTSGLQEIELVAGTYYYGAYAATRDTFLNVWPTAADSNATVRVYAISGIAGKTSFVEGTQEIKASSGGRYAVYFEDAATKPMAVRIVVTAENGDTASYVLVMSKAETQSAGEALLSQIQAEDIAKANQAAADAVIEKINAIGTVTLESEEAIEAARTAYNALSDVQKALVANLETLTAAEAAYAELTADTENSGNTEPPKTGDSTPIVLLVTVMVVSLAGIAVILFRKKYLY